MELELFSEVYNCYYLVVRRILSEAAARPLSEKELIQLADTYGYEETALTIVPKLLSGDWNLLKRTAEGFRSRVNEPEPLPLTSLQRSWLKSLLSDSKFHLFFSDETYAMLETALAGTPALFCQQDFFLFDQYSDGDPVTSYSYRKHFKQLLEGIRDNTILDIDYYSAKNRLTSRHYLPCRIEYSPKDNKFRLMAVRVKKDGQAKELMILSISRILQIKDTKRQGASRPDINNYLEKSLCPEPVILEISNERNALERTMLHFACYQKQTEKLGDSGKYICRIYYNKDVETELLIQVLSFGPVVKVLGPKGFLTQIKERVLSQKRLLESQERV